MKRFRLLAPIAVVTFSLPFAACGGKKALSVDGGAPSASVSASAAPSPTASPSQTDPDRDKAITRACTQKAERECESLEHDRPEFFENKRADIAQSPFDVKVDR